MPNTLQQLHRLRRQAMRVNTVCKHWQADSDAPHALIEQCVLESRHVARAAASWISASPDSDETFRLAPGIAMSIAAAALSAMRRSDVVRLRWLAGQFEQLRATVTLMQSMHVSSEQQSMLERHRTAIERIAHDVGSELGSDVGDMPRCDAHRRRSDDASYRLHRA
jgi:hypothetical protein